MTLGRGRAACSASPASQKFATACVRKKGPRRLMLDQAVKAFLRGFQQVFALGRRYARVVHQKVNPAEAVDHRLEQLLATVRHGNIPWECIKGGPGTRRGCRLAQLLAFRRRVAVGSEIDRDAVAGASQGNGNSPSDSSRRACY